MNPFKAASGNNGWVLPVSTLSLVLGFMMTLAWITRENRNTRLPSLDPAQASRLRAGTIDVQEEYVKLTEEVKKLRADNTKLQNAMGEGTKQTSVLNEALQDTKDFAGLTEVEGPGISVTLRDSDKPINLGMPAEQYAIHDIDVLRVVNELWAAGAEAIAVNTHRITAGSSFRCVGPVIHVDGIAISSPVRIRAIGDPEVLIGALKLPLGVLAELTESDPSMVQIEKVERHRLPAFSGSTARKLAKPVEAKP